MNIIGIGSLFTVGVLLLFVSVRSIVREMKREKYPLFRWATGLVYVIEFVFNDFSWPTAGIIIGFLFFVSSIAWYFSAM